MYLDFDVLCHILMWCIKFWVKSLNIDHIHQFCLTTFVAWHWLLILWSCRKFLHPVSKFYKWLGSIQFSGMELWLKCVIGWNILFRRLESLQCAHSQKQFQATTCGIKRRYSNSTIPKPLKVFERTISSTLKIGDVLIGWKGLHTLRLTAGIIRFCVSPYSATRHLFLQKKELLDLITYTPPLFLQVLFSSFDFVF